MKAKLKSRIKSRLKTLIIATVLLLLLVVPTNLFSQPGLNESDIYSGVDESVSSNESSESTDAGIPIPKIPFVEKADSPEDVGTAFSTIILLTVLSLAPSIIILFTSFIRIAIVFSFTRTALATQQIPPNQVLYGLALVLTVFIMAPVFTQIYDNAYMPYQDGELTLDQFGERAMEPIREFMFRQMDNNGAKRSLKLFIKLGNIPKPKGPDDVPLHVLVPAFVLNELTRAFTMGVMIFIPFIIIDLVVSSVLLSIGIIFLPPVIVSLPIKIILFVLVDGWNFLVEGLIMSFT